MCRAAAPWGGREAVPSDADPAALVRPFSYTTGAISKWSGSPEVRSLRATRPFEVPKSTLSWAYSLGHRTCEGVETGAVSAQRQTTTSGGKTWPNGSPGHSAKGTLSHRT